MPYRSCQRSLSIVHRTAATWRKYYPLVTYRRKPEYLDCDRTFVLCYSHLSPWFSPPYIHLNLQIVSQLAKSFVQFAQWVRSVILFLSMASLLLLPLLLQLLHCKTLSDDLVNFIRGSICSFELFSSVASHAVTVVIPWTISLNDVDSRFATVSVGDTVTWTWMDELPHSILGDSCLLCLTCPRNYMRGVILYLFQEETMLLDCSQEGEGGSTWWLSLDLTTLTRLQTQGLTTMAASSTPLCRER